MKKYVNGERDDQDLGNNAAMALNRLAVNWDRCS